MDYCQLTPTGAGLAHLAGVRRLAMESSDSSLVAHALDQGLPATVAELDCLGSFAFTVGGELWSA
jgi:hypothetical protein